MKYILYTAMNLTSVPRAHIKKKKEESGAVSVHIHVMSVMWSWGVGERQADP